MTRSQHRAPRLLAGVIAALLVGCSAQTTVDIHTDHDPTAEFAGFRTYGWVPGRPAAPAVNRGNDPFLESRLRAIPQVIEQALVEKGFRKDPNGRPDFRVAYRVATEKARIDSFQDYGWYKRAGGSKDLGTAYVTGYEEGSLTIDIVSASGERLLWRGTARAVVDDSIPTTERQARLERAVRQLLHAFPPR